MYITQYWKVECYFLNVSVWGSKFRRQIKDPDDLWFLGLSHNL